MVSTDGTSARQCIPKTGATRIVDTLEFFPHHFPMPHTTATDQLLDAAHDMIQALQQPIPQLPTNQSQTTHKALRQLANIFKDAASPRVEREDKENTPPARVKKEKQGHHHKTQAQPPKPPKQTPKATMYVEDLELLNTTHQVHKVEMPQATENIQVPRVTKIAQQKV